MSDPTQTQLSSLPPTTTFITGHNEAGRATVEHTRPAAWRAYDDDKMAFNPIFTNAFPADLNGGVDIKDNDELIRSGKLGLVKKGGVVTRQVDFSPGYACMMHRTSSLDFGIVLEGTIEMVLDDGSKTVMRRGDVAVQRATMHQWRNVSGTEWARMQFVLQDVRAVRVNGEVFGEDLGVGVEGLPGSGND